MALLEGNSRKVQEINDENKNYNTNRVKKLHQKPTKNKKNKRRSSQSFARFGCFRVETDEDGGVDMEVQFPKERGHPSHLVVMCSKLEIYSKAVIEEVPRRCYCSFERNSSILTFDGVDVMGDRLAEEVKSVISRHPSVEKISFVGHSLGGLVARYAIARLFEQDLTQENSQTNGGCRTDQLGDSWPEGKLKGKIAGLEPMNFITLASPHLGSRWHRQVPLFHGSHVLEKVAARTSWFLGGTGKHLFLTDGKDGKPPLLLRMASDGEDLKININVDYFNEYQIKHLPRGDKYPHVVNVETGKTATPDEVPYEAKINGTEKMNMEEEMIRGLKKMSWERADVYFKGSRQRLLAHLAIQVSNYWANSDGADVIQHMIDNFLS